MESRQGVAKIEDLEVFYEGIQAIHGISLEIFRGEMVTIVGANRTGKSTLFKTLAGDRDCRSETIVFRRQPLPSKSYRFVGKETNLVPEGRKVFVNLTVCDNLMVEAYVVRQRSVIPERPEEVYNLFPRLREREKRMGGTLSGGEQQILAVRQAMTASPKLMMLDEPSLELAPTIIGGMFRKSIRISKKYGTTIVIVKQSARLALETTHRGYVLNVGKIQMGGGEQALLNNPRVQEVYLGFK